MSALSVAEMWQDIKLSQQFASS